MREGEGREEEEEEEGERERERERERGGGVIKKYHFEIGTCITHRMMERLTSLTSL